MDISKINVNGTEYNIRGTAYSAATTETDGLMSAADKTKLDNIASGATANTGTVTSIKVGTTDYNPSDGVVTIPAYPTTLPASDVSAWAKASTKPSYSANEIGLGNVGNFKAVSTEASLGLTSTELANARTNIGAGTSSLELGDTSSTAYRGDLGKIAYEHSLSNHARTDATKTEASEVNGNIKINGTETNVYTHPGSGTNPHGTTKNDVGLGNVGNFKAVSTDASQGLTSTEQANARANIGAGTSSFSGSYNDLSNKPSLFSGSYDDLSNKPTIPSLSGYATENWVSNKFDDVLGINASGIDALTTALSDNDKTTGILKAISNKVEKESGKRLMTDSEATKLSGIEAGAQTHRAPSTAEVKSALGTGSGTTKYLREDGTWATPPDTNTWPTATSQLTNDSGYITSYTDTVTSINGKTGAIAASDIAAVLTAAGYALTDTNTWPTYTSLLTNDSGYITSTEINTSRLFFRNFGVNGFSNCDSMNAQGITTIDGHSQGPDSSANVTVLNLGELDSDQTRFKQLLFNYLNDNIYYRRKNGDGPWTSWISLITSSNIGSQSVKYATTAGSAPASDVYSWAKASTKPSYSWSEISSRPTNVSSFTNDSGYITGITSSMVTSALGYTPPSSDTNTVTSINGKTGDIAAADIAAVLTSAGYALTDTNTWPTSVSQLSNDVGYITSSGSCAFAISAGNADMVDNCHTISYTTDWNTTSSHPSIFISSENNTSNAPTTDHTYGIKMRFHRHDSYYQTDLVTSLYSDALFYRRHYEDNFGNWKQIAFTDSNISGNAATATYATSAGSASSATGAGYANQLQAFTGDNFTGGDHFVKAIRSSDGWSTKLWMCYNGGAAQADAVSVNYANSAGYADSAGSVAWSNVSSRPTTLSSFTNDVGYITGYTDTKPTYSYDSSTETLTLGNFVAA